MDHSTAAKEAKPKPPVGVYRQFLAEREEILRHKWLRSEAKGRDIGFDCALTEWIQVHRRKWRNSRHNGNA